MGSGRTKPARFSCDDDGGSTVGEFVVKLKGGVDSGVTGLLCELFSSLLARVLGIAAPEPALVELDVSLAQILPVCDADVAEIIRDSGGLNFGSRLLTRGYRTWPIDMAIPFSLRQIAADVFAFDALIQNPDRRYNNPNLLWRDEEIFVIDHESAFSFIYHIGAPRPPWKLDSMAYLDEHVFYRTLKGGKIEVDRFVGALEAMSDDVLLAAADQVPNEWKSEHLTTIIEHLKLTRDHATEFGEQVKRRLA